MSLTRPKIAQFDTTATALRDPLTIINSGSAEANVDIGFIMNRSASVSNVALYWSESGNTFSVAFTGNSGITNSNVYATSYANLRAGDGTFNSISTDGFTWTSNGEPVTLGGVSTVSDTPPTSPNAGDIWFNTSDDIWYVYQLTEGGLYWVDMYTQTLNPTLITASDLSINGNILPSGNVIYNLGSPSARWKDLYLSGSTIDLNGSRISSTSSAIVIANPIGGSFEISGTETGKASATFGNVAINSGVTSTSVYTGALTVDGGVGVLGNVRASAVYTDNLKFANGNPYTSTTLANTAEITANISSGTNAGLSLVATGVTAGNYGSATSIPTIVVDAKGRITSITSNAVSTTISLAGTSGTGSVAGGGTLTFAGSHGVTATASSSTITIDTPQDLRTTANVTFDGATFNNDVVVHGNIYADYLNTINSNQLIVDSGLVYLETEQVYPYDFDIGMYGHFRGGPANAYGHTGGVRSSEYGWWGFFSNVKPEPTNVVNWTDSGIIWDQLKVGSMILANTTTSTSTTTGALVVGGGAGIGGAVYADSVHVGESVVTASAISTGTLTAGTVNPVYLNVGNDATFGTASGGGLQVNAIGNVTPGTGAFTTLSSQTETVGGLQAVAIGNVTPGTAAFTTATAGGLQAVAIGNVTPGTGVFTTGTFNTATIGGLQAVAIGNVTPGTGAFTTGTFNTATIGGLQAVAIGNVTPGTGAFTTGTFSSTLGVTGATTLTTATAGGLQAVAIGNVTPGTGAFTTLTASGATSLTANTASTSSSTGTLVVTGGVGISGDVYQAAGKSIYGGVTTSGNGDLNQPYKLANDYNSWATIFGPSWTSANGWGIFWAGNQDAAFGTNGNGASNSGPGNIWSNSTNPNELVMVGGGATQWTCHLSDGRTWQRGALFCASDVYSSYSDIRLKNIVGYIEDPIALLKQIEVFYYEPNEEALKLGATPGRKVGVSAQSALKVQPETVGASGLGKDYLTVQYERLVPLLIETCKKQQDQIEELQRQVEALQINAGKQ